VARSQTTQQVPWTIAPSCAVQCFKSLNLVDNLASFGARHSELLHPSSHFVKKDGKGKCTGTDQRDIGFQHLNHLGQRCKKIPLLNINSTPLWKQAN